MISFKVEEYGDIFQTQDDLDSIEEYAKRKGENEAELALSRLREAMVPLRGLYNILKKKNLNGACEIIERESKMSLILFY